MCDFVNSVIMVWLLFLVNHVIRFVMSVNDECEIFLILIQDILETGNLPKTKLFNQKMRRWKASENLILPNSRLYPKNSAKCFTHKIVVYRYNLRQLKSRRVFHFKTNLKFWEFLWIIRDFQNLYLVLWCQALQK